MGRRANERRRRIVQEVEEADQRRFEEKKWMGVYAAEATRQRLERERLKVAKEQERQRVGEGTKEQEQEQEQGEEITSLNDPQVVRTDSLMEIVARFIETWDGASPQEVASANGRANVSNLGAKNVVNGYEPATHHVVPLSARAYLCEKASLTWDQLLNLERRRSKVTSLMIADSLLAAMGCPQAMHDGRIQVVPNPRWGLDRWEAWMRNNGGCISGEVGFTTEAGV